MSAAEFRQGDEPAIRRANGGHHLDGYRCPFCGAEQLILSNADLPIDTERVEVYCDNKPECEACEIVILVKRGATAHRRADVWALRAVDEGTEAEQEADGRVFERDDAGKVTASVLSFNKASTARSRGERDNQTLERRRRLTDVTINPVAPEP